MNEQRRRRSTRGTAGLSVPMVHAAKRHSSLYCNFCNGKSLYPFI